MSSPKHLVGGVFMRMTRWFVVLFALGFAAAVAKADTAVDPKITIGGGGSCNAGNPFQITSLSQSFDGLQTGCLLDFQNSIGSDDDEEGVTLNQIVVNVTSPFDGPLSCEIGEGSPFNNGVVSSPTSCTFNNITITLLSSLFSPTGGVGPGGVFSLTFDPNFGSTVDITLSQNVIGTPEPASALLLLAGAGALAAFRKRRQAAA